MQYSAQSLYDQSVSKYYNPNETEVKLRMDLCEKLYTRLAPWEVIATDGKFIIHYDLSIEYGCSKIIHSSATKTVWISEISIKRRQGDKLVTQLSKYWTSEKVNDEIVNAAVAMLSWESDYRKFKRENTSVE